MLPKAAIFCQLQVNTDVSDSRSWVEKCQSGKQSGLNLGKRKWNPQRRVFYLLLEHSMVIKGRLTRACTDPTLWLAWLPPFTPSASTWIPGGQCEAQEMPQGLSLRNTAVACQQARQLEWGCLQLCSQAEPDFRFWPPDKTWEEVFHVLNSFSSVCWNCTCCLLWLLSRGWSMHFTKVQRVLHLFKIHRSTPRSQPGRKMWGRPSTQQDELDHFRKITDTFVLSQTFFL